VHVARALAERPFEGRLAGAFNYLPPARRGDAAAPDELVDVASDLHRAWELDHTTAKARAAGAAFLLLGHAAEGKELLGDALMRSTGQADILTAIHRSDDRALLTDFSAASLTQTASTGDARGLLLAFESADRAYALGSTPEAAWNRALAIDRLGFSALAARAWHEAASADRGSPWSREADERRSSAQRHAAASAPPSEELFFQRELIGRAAAIAGGPATIDGANVSYTIDDLAEAGRHRQVASGDYLASDTAGSLRQLLRNGPEADRRRLLAGLTAYAHGRAAFEADRLADALPAFRAAETDLAAVHSPLVVLARDQRIRCQCWHREPSCLENLRTLHADLDASKRYPWLAARTAYAEGQTLYRQGRIYEAAESFRAAQAGLRRTNDAAGEALVHSLLANVLAMAGETDLALSHYLAGLRLPPPAIGDRRRRQISDLATFLLRHGFISTTEPLLDELDRWPATDEGRADAVTLRGVIHARRGNAAAATVDFRKAHALAEAIADETVRAETRNALAVAEAGARAYAPATVLAEIDAAIARHETFDNSVFLPQLLVERGALEEARNDRAGAKRDYLRAMELVEMRAPRVDEMLIGFGIASDIESPFEHAISLMLSEGRPADALAAADRAMALRISALYAPSAGLRDPFRGVADGSSGDSLTAVRPLLRADQVIVVQHLLRNELVSWIITTSGLSVVRHPIAAASLIARVEHLRQCAAKPECRDQQGLEQVSEALLRGWIDRVPREATVILSPPADLKSVPFPMLTTRGNEPLLRRNVVVTTPGLRAYVRAVRNDAARRGDITAFFAAAPHPGGDRPPLPLAEREVTLASRAYPGAVVDTQATRARFLERAASFSIVHFAGHAAVNPQQPLLSALVFEPGEPQLLYVHELEGRSFANARLVVLSGCETGMAPLPTMSIAHALLSQDVPSVVYTSWPVADDAAEQFAIELHRALASGESRAAALRHAELALLQSYPERPEAWAAFAISGAAGPLIRQRKRKGDGQ
jgi:CHAT domain-containing protein/tetratricopeptide (TPR) repeat protein